ncbi:hypothetical protein GCM10007938_34650 [Vibrio zhanjiangensis]|uniref:Transposase n=2 Tax=Vibrio zhanjiangensis TaxID=1046128 RepID=A0ABQ6F2H1_9VIBR|nr:hypothetical protein GCM10007938_34650 [Vibrio zhanjiangensis]
MFDARWVNHASQYELSSYYLPLQPKSNNGVLWFATGDAQTGYILCQHVNYSGDEEPLSDGDHDPYNDSCRLVCRGYAIEQDTPISSTSLVLKERIDLKYQAILARNNVEDPMGNLSHFHYPTKGALIRPPYTSYAHFLHVLSLCNDNRRVILYLPQDPVLRSAALSVALQRIQHKTIDLLYVDEDDNWNGTNSIDKIDILHMGWWRDRWAMTSNKEASKGICYLAGNNSDPKEWLNRASIRQIAFYQHRFQTLFEDFINEPRRKLRPGGLLPLLDIFRAWHNLCYQGRNGRTAAQNLGITQSPLTLKELLS